MPRPLIHSTFLHYERDGHSLPVTSPKSTEHTPGKETYGDEEKVLKSLLDAFGSTFSLKEIASAYFKAGYNADLAGEVLYQMQESPSSSASNGEVGDEDYLGETSEKSFHTSRNSKTSKPKSRPFSAGTISNVIGKEYARPKPSANQFSKTSKPLKLDIEVLNEFSVQEESKNSTRDFQLHHDMEDFLYKMLGDGVRIKREVIREVLGSCGYDMKKSMEELLNLLTTPVDERLGSGTKSTDMFTASYSKSNLSSCQGNRPDTLCPGRNGNMAPSKKDLELSSMEKTRIDLQKEVLTALFNAFEDQDDEELPRRIVPRIKRSGAFGNLVSEPLRDIDAECEKHVKCKEQNDLDVEDEEENYQLLRKAVREYRSTMKEYYAAAIDAFAKGDSVRAAKLVDQGHFFHQKAQEADDESSQLIFEPRNADTQDEILLDLRDHDAKEAVKIVKSQISSLCGIPSIKHLKVVMEANDRDSSKRRRLVMKLLEKESIEWREEEIGGSILIRLDTINRKRLSFVKKMQI